MSGLLEKDMRLLFKRKQIFAIIIVVELFLGMSGSGTFAVVYFTMLAGIIAAGTLSYDEFDNGFINGEASLIQVICHIDRGPQSDITGDIGHVDAPDVRGGANHDWACNGFVGRIRAFGKDGIIAFVQDPDSEDVPIPINLLLLLFRLFWDSGGQRI